MSRFTTKQQLVDDIALERERLEALLASIPPADKGEEVIDGLTVKDILAHRTEWGRMMIGWYEASCRGETPAVPSERYKWNQLPELNAEIQAAFADVPLTEIEASFAEVHDRLATLVDTTDDEELFTKHRHTFTGSSDLATYLNSATAAHYRSARKHIAKWWRARQGA